MMIQLSRLAVFVALVLARSATLGHSTSTGENERETAQIAQIVEDSKGGDGSCACTVSRQTMEGDELPPPSKPPATRLPNASMEGKENCKIALQSMVEIPGRVFDMGTNSPGMESNGEEPRRKVRVSSFLIDKYEVNNLQFDEFARDTGYQTDAERWKWSFVLHSAMTREQQRIAEVDKLVRDAPWWALQEGSYWKEPEGAGTNVFWNHERWGDRSNYPAVHISWNDADAFCKWRDGSRLPSEAEWELAARGPKENKVFPWGNKLTPNSTYKANIFTGDFPIKNTKEDGYLYAAPVDAFGPQNEYGLYNMIGNVWEWVSDWWTIQHPVADVLENPTGPEEGVEKVKKGGSFLCHKSYCYRYRNAARFKVEADSGTQNSGFRCAKDTS